MKLGDPIPRRGFLGFVASAFAARAITAQAVVTAPAVATLSRLPLRVRPVASAYQQSSMSAFLKKTYANKEWFVPFQNESSTFIR